MDQSRLSIPFGTFGENRHVSKRLMKKAARAFFRVRADASEEVVREKRWMRVARKGKSAISCGHRETVCRSQERNTIGGDIDLPWELPCATSWRSYARATSRFFFRDSNASRRRRRRHRRLFSPFILRRFPSPDFKRVPPFFTPPRKFPNLLGHF